MRITELTRAKKDFKQGSHVWQVEELLSEIQVSLRYWLEEDICDDLSECEMNRDTARGRARERESCARWGCVRMILVWKALCNRRKNVSFLTCLAVPCVLFIFWQQIEEFCVVFRENKRAMIVHQEEYCAQCATWSSSSGSQETCADIFHTRMAGISHTNYVFELNDLYILWCYNVSKLWYIICHLHPGENLNNSCSVLKCSLLWAYADEGGSMYIGYSYYEIMRGWNHMHMYSL